MVDAISIGNLIATSLLIIASFASHQYGTHGKSVEQNFVATNREIHVEDVLESIVRFAGGEDWPYGKYHYTRLTTSEKISSDAEIESHLNGTNLGALDGSAPEWAQMQLELSRKIELSMKSRRELPIHCSEASRWGYASAYEEQLSDEPHRDDDKCASQLEQLDTFVKWLLGEESDHQVALDRFNPAPSRSVKFKLHHYNQFHSFGRLPSGPPHKQNLLLGDYDNCARLESTRYCLGAYGDGRRWHLNDGAGHPPTLYHIGLCLPRACSGELLRRSAKLMEILNSIVKVNLPGGAVIPQNHERHLKLQDVFCPPAEDSLYLSLTKDWPSRALLSLALIWLTMLIYGTFFCVNLQNSNEKRPLVDSFNLAGNWHLFLGSRRADRKLASLNAVKTIGMVWLMTTHLSIILFPFVKNMNELHVYYETRLQGPLVLQGQHAVSLFFMISGLLVGLMYLDSGRTKAGMNLKLMILWRYSRSMPLYLLAWLYIRQFWHLIGTGPLWDYGVSAQSELRHCRAEPLWLPILTLANLVPAQIHCVSTGWHIANDMQIFMVLPPLLLAYRRSRTLGSFLALAIYVLSHLTHFWNWGTAEHYDMYQNMRDISRFGPRLILERLALDYYNPLGRLGAHFLGVVLADLLLNGGFNGPTNNSVKDDQMGGRNINNRRSSSLPNLLNECELKPPTQNNKPLREKLCAEPLQSLGELLPTTSEEKNNNNNDNDNDSQTGKQIQDTKMTKMIASQSFSFKDTTLLTLGLLLLLFVMFSPLLPPDWVPTFGSYTNAINYPLCRILIELSWAILLYYLLRASMTKIKPSTGISTGKKEEEEEEEKFAKLPTASGCGFVQRFLELPFWNVLSKPNYCVMLTHCTVMRYVVQSQRDLFHFTWVNFAQITIFLVLSSYLLAVILHLAIEMPLSVLIEKSVSRALSAGRGCGGGFSSGARQTEKQQHSKVK